MEDTKTQPTPEGNQLQPLQVLHCADGWIAVFKKSIHVGAGEFFLEARESNYLTN